MRLSPLDIKKQEFSRTIRRGYDPEEVQAFLDMLATQWEDLLADERRTEDKVRELKAKMEHYEKVEEALQEALRTARENSRHALDNAKQEAALIVKTANAEAEDLARDAVRRRDGLLKEVDVLLARRDEIITRLRAFLTAESELLERFDERYTEAAAPSPDKQPAVSADVESLAYAEDSVPLETETRDEDETGEVLLDEEVEEQEEVFQAVTEEEPLVEEPLAEEPLAEEPVDETPVVAEIKVEVIAETAVPEIEVEVMAETPRKQTDPARSEEEDPGAFFQEDPKHFSVDEEPLSFKFFESNEEDHASLFVESDETQFAPIPEDTTRRNGHRSRSQDRSPSDSTWIVRPVVSSPQASEMASGDTQQSDEIDKIRRILSDLD